MTWIVLCSGDPTLESVFPTDEIAIDDNKLVAPSAPDVESSVVVADAIESVPDDESADFPGLDTKHIADDIPMEASELENVAQFK